MISVSGYFALRAEKRSLRPALFLLLGALCGIPGQGSAQATDACAVYAAALAQLVPDTVTTIVVYDSVSLALPSFAFHAWTGMGLPKADSKVPLSDSMWQQIRRTYSQREALPTCFGVGRTVVRVPYDSLIAQFKDREKGWDRFHAVFPTARGFLIAGRPYFLTEAHTEALVYIASASHWLSGSGIVMYLEKHEGTWVVIGRHSMWAS